MALIRMISLTNWRSPRPKFLERRRWLLSILKMKLRPHEPKRRPHEEEVSSSFRCGKSFCEGVSSTKNKAHRIQDIKDAIPRSMDEKSKTSNLLYRDASAKPDSLVEHHRITDLPRKSSNRLHQSKDED